MNTKCKLLSFLFFICILFPLLCEEIDFNDYYKYPISIGVGYQNLNPLTELDSDFNIIDIFVDTHVPLPFMPVFQGNAQFGMINFDARDEDFPVKWDHSHWYGLAGASYINRFIKELEIGADIHLGLSQSVFNDLVDEPVGNMNFLFRGGGRISLAPTYNFSLDIRPNITFIKSLSDYTNFDSALIGVTFSANYRFGQDPDSLAGLIKSIKFENSDIPPIFGAMQSYYSKNSFGTIVVRNTEKFTLRNIELYFYQDGFMDSSTLVKEIPVLKSGDELKVELIATFNQEIFTTEGITPLTGEIIANYKIGARTIEQRHPVNYDLYDKNSIVWDDDRKVAAFITPSDSAIRNYASFIRKSTDKYMITRYNKALQTAIQVFYGLEEIGCLYQEDPSSPFTKVQEDTHLVDSVSLPRDTLSRITGDCDDLTVLFNSLCESVGIETGFITTPGHIYSAINTGLPAKKYAYIHPDRNRTIIVDGHVWIPVEITYIGKKNFLSAWQTGSDEWRAFPGNRNFYISQKAQELFRPVGLREVDLGLQYGNGKTISSNFKTDLDKIKEVVLEPFAINAKNKNDKADYNKLGLIYIEFEKFSEAKEAFQTAIKLDKNYIPGVVNLANLAYLADNYNNAIKEYENALKILEKMEMEESPFYQKILINLAKSYYVTKKFDKANELYLTAAAISEEGITQYSYLASASTASDSANTMNTDNGVVRAGADENDMFFLED